MSNSTPIKVLVPEVGHTAGWHRITSYNVCYTKLLRDKLTVYKSNSGVYLLIRVNELEHNNTDNTRLNQWQEKEVLNHSICHRNDYIEYIIKKGREFGIRINKVSKDMILLKFSSISDDKISEAIQTIFAKC